MHRPSFGPHNNPVRQEEQKIIISVLQVGKHAQRIYMACPKSKSEPGTKSQFFRAPSLYQSIPEKSCVRQDRVTGLEILNLEQEKLEHI